MAAGAAVVRGVWCVLLILGVMKGLVTSSRLTIIHSPDYVHFDKTASGILSSEVSRAVELAMGLQSQQDIKWTGLGVGDLFKRPRASVLIIVNGLSSLDLPNTLNYPIEEDIPNIETEELVGHIQGTFYGSHPLTVDLASGNNIYTIQDQYPKIFHNVPGTLSKLGKVLRGTKSILNGLDLGTLNASMTENTLLAELQLIQEIIRKLPKSNVQDSVPDFYGFNILGYQEIVDVYGKTSQKAEDAKKLLAGVLNKFTEQFVKLYDGHILVELATLDSFEKASIRKTRSLLSQTPLRAIPLAVRINLATQHGVGYSAIFNIILWMSIILVLALIAICYSLWYMDPGRDSIIYRMTTQRLKSD